MQTHREKTLCIRNEFYLHSYESPLFLKINKISLEARLAGNTELFDLHTEVNDLIQRVILAVFPIESTLIEEFRL